MKSKWKFGIAIWKWIKNGFFIFGAPALLYLGANLSEWIPNEYATPGAIVASAILYILKNRVDFNKR